MDGCFTVLRNYFLNFAGRTGVDDNNEILRSPRRNDHRKAWLGRFVNDRFSPTFKTIRHCALEVKREESPVGFSERFKRNRIGRVVAQHEGTHPGIHEGSQR